MRRVWACRTFCLKKKTLKWKFKTNYIFKILTDLWWERFAGGLDGHQHLPLRLVLLILRFGGSVLLHPASLGRKWRRRARLGEMALDVFLYVSFLPPSRLWPGPGLQQPSSTSTACWSCCRCAETCCRSSEARLWWDSDASNAPTETNFKTHSYLFFVLCNIWRMYWYVTPPNYLKNISLLSFRDLMTKFDNNRIFIYWFIFL